ncbi:hypothetical protein ACP70R_027362 [Stipagrostis hirtigluma subsp. patula]
MRRSPQWVMSQSCDAGGGKGLLARYAKARPRPSKWDDAQRWLSSSRKTGGDDDDRRRSSCADDRTLLPSASQRGRHSWSDADGAVVPATLATAARDEGETETKRVDSVQAYGSAARSLSFRDVGTEMTPAGSKEPSRANTPRAALVAMPAPAKGASHAPPRRTTASAKDGGSSTRAAADRDTCCVGADTKGREEAAGAPTAVSPASAWDAAERAKHMARYRREEMKIQAWENRRRQKAELQLKMTEAKAERMKLRAQEKTASKLAAAQAAAQERRERAEAKLNRRAARAGDKADLLRRSGHLPSSGFSLKLPMMCS